MSDMLDTLDFDDNPTPNFEFRPLAKVSDLRKRWPALTNAKDDDVLYAALVDATREIEDRTSRRIAPFTGHLEEMALVGTNPNEYGGGGNDLPMSLQGSLGQSYASALGINGLIRRFWLDEYAPRYPEMWEYEVTELLVQTTYGSYQDVLSSNGLIDLEKTNGFAWLTIGFFAPEESRVRIVYNGGYVYDTPGSLQRACLLQAVEFLIMESEPQLRDKMSIDEIERQITKLVAPWVKGP
jgi:hypothetical protein